MESDVRRQFRTLSDFAFVVMKEWILTHRLQPGERIDQDRVAELLGVSKMPVRSGLEKLQAQGLVHIIPHRGAVVADLSQDEVDELGLLRQVLESLATREAVPHVTPVRLHELEQSLLLAENSVATENWDEYLRASRDFHMTLYAASGRSLLVRMIGSLWDLSDRYRRLYLSNIEEVRTQVLEHREIWAAVARHDASGAARLVERHTARLREGLVEMFGESSTTAQGGVDSGRQR